MVATQVPDPVGDMGGDLLYAVAVYVGLVLLLPGVRPTTAGAAALAWCWLVELLQATGAVGAVVAAVPPAVWVLGSTFAVRDLLLYLVGVALAWATDSWWAGRPRSVSRPSRRSG